MAARVAAQEHHVPGGSIVFAANVRFSERCVPLLSRLLTAVCESQLLLWTGTGELPVHPNTHSRLKSQLGSLGFSERVGFDVQIARSCCQLTGTRAVDCTFFSSRWVRWLCGCTSGAALARLSSSAAGERQPLVRESSNGSRTPNLCSTPCISPNPSGTVDAPVPRRIEMAGAHLADERV
jgi:hypothetical protein